MKISRAFAAYLIVFLWLWLSNGCNAVTGHDADVGFWTAKLLQLFTVNSNLADPGRLAGNGLSVLILLAAVYFFLRFTTPKRKGRPDK